MTPTACEAAVTDYLSEPHAAAAARERTEFDRRATAHPGRFVLFGAGNTGRKLLAQLRATGAEPLAFTDNGSRLWGTEVDGVPVLSPTDAAAQYGSTACFIVTIWNPSHSYRETVLRLADLGCDTVLPLTLAQWKFPAAFLPLFWADLPSKHPAHAADVRRAARLWADDFSRREYAGQIRWRMTGDIHGTAEPVREASYFPDDVFRLAEDEVFVDCGAYNGCTISEFLARTEGQFGHVTALEPDPANFAKLTAYLDGLPAGVRGRVTTVAAAVGRGRERLRFRADGTMGAGVSATGDTEVECVTLDDLARDRIPTYIKMDIEGAEPDAVAGGRGVIAAHRPILAVCLYHELTHLWAVPLAIDALAPGGYQFYLRPHELDGWQLVCYAVPPERVLSRREALAPRPAYDRR